MSTPRPGKRPTSKQSAKPANGLAEENLTSYDAETAAGDSVLAESPTMAAEVEIAINDSEPAEATGHSEEYSVQDSKIVDPEASGESSVEPPVAEVAKKSTPEKSKRGKATPKKVADIEKVAEEAPVLEDVGDVQSPSPGSEPSVEIQERVKKPGVLLRLLTWIGSLFSRKPKAKAEVVAPVEVFDEKWARSAARELKKLQARRAAAERTAESIQVDLTQLAQEQVRIETWLEGLKRSYYWKLEQRMEQNLGQAKADIAEYESLVRALELPPKGALKSLREKFHKGLIVNFITFAIPTFLLFFIPWFSRADLFRWLVDLLRSPLFIVLVVTIGAVVAGVFLMLRRVLGSKKVPTKKTLKWTFISMLVPLALYGLFRFKDFLAVVVTPVIEEIRPVALWVILILFVFLTLALLIIYYQGWSVFRRKVTDEVSRLENVAAGYVKTRQELARLSFLYGQTIDWMKLLAHTLYRPWKIHPDWKSPNQAQAVSESFPMALRVAQAVENDASESAQLRRTIALRLLVQGWRTAAFEKSLSEIGRYLGYEPDKVNPQLLDSDLPHQPNNSRSLVLEYFEHSSETAIAGTLDLSNQPADQERSRSKPLPSDIYLVEVAREQMRYLIDKTQGSALAQARPSVQQIVKNPLAELTDADNETDSLEVSRWDEFLSEGLGIEDATQPPIGVLAFSDEGKKAKSPSDVRSEVLVPERFATSLPAPLAPNLKVTSIESSDQSQPAEIMLRFDVVGPLPFNHVTLVQNATSVRQAEHLDQEENDDL